MADPPRLPVALRRFVRRERLAVAILVLAWVGSVTALGALTAGVAPWTGTSPALWAGLLGMVLFAAIGAAWSWGMRAWSEAGQIERQARRVEAVRRDLRGLAVALAGPRQPASSAAIVARADLRAAAAVDAVATDAVMALGPAFGACAMTVALSASAVATWLLPPGPGARWAWWAQGAPSLDAQAGAAATPKARVGDLVLRLVWPSYTGLPPQLIENGTGDVEGPPGTLVEVSLRIGREAEVAALWVGDVAGPAAVEGGREVRGSFLIGPSSTTWHVSFAPPESRSAEFQVRSVPDRAPEVAVDAPVEGLLVPADAPIGLPWRASDDFGVVEVALRVDGVEALVGRRRIMGHQTTVEGTVSVRPSELGLQPGQEAVLEVVARDGNTVGGVGEGRSLPVTVRVDGPGARERIMALRDQRLRALLVPILAEFLVEAWPPGASGAAVSTWGAGVGARYRSLFDEIGRVGLGQVHPLVADVVESGTALVRFTQVAFEPDDPTPGSPRTVSETAALRADAVEDLEDALLLLELRARGAALARLSASVEDLGELGPDVPARVATPGVAATIDAVERSGARVRRDAHRIEPGGLQDLVMRRMKEVERLGDAIMAAEEADVRRRLGGRLSDRMIELAEAVAADLDRRQRDGEEAARAAMAAIEALEQLAEDQDALRGQVAARRSAAREGSDASLRAAWVEAEAAAKDLSERAVAYRDGLRSAGRRFHETERAAAVAEGSDRARDAVRARDLRGARAANDGVSATTAVLRRVAAIEAARGGGPGTAEAGALGGAADRLRAALDRLSALSQAARSGSGASEYGDDQLQLSGRLESSSAGAREIARELPVAPDGIERSLDGARQRMNEARQDLEDALALEAEGAQGAAAEDLREAARLLRAALAASQSGGPGSGEDGGGLDGVTLATDDPIDLPDIEEFVRPDAYRQALLEALRGDVPASWRNARARYYQELVSP